MENLTKDYGLYGLIAYVVIKEIWPFFRDKFFPEKIRFAQTQENRLTEAIEGINTAMQLMAQATTAQNEKLANMVLSQSEHNRFTVDAVTAMLVKTGTIPNRKTQPKL